MLSQQQNAALVLIDVQEGLDEPRLGVRNNPEAELRMAALLDLWRQNEWPVFHIQHQSTEPNSPLRPELPGCAIKEVVTPLPHEPVLQKNVNSAFIGTTLEFRLINNKIDTIVFVGLTTDHCVSTSVRMAANLGFRSYVVSDATACFDRIGPSGDLYSAEQIHELALVELHEEFATIIDTEQLLNSLSPEGVYA